jgi:hypothetical protein
MKKVGFALMTSLPAVSASLAGVLAISHGAYLANKVPDRPGAGGAGAAGGELEKIKIVSLKVGKVEAGTFTEASNGIPGDKVAVQVRPQSSVSNAPATGAAIQVELRPKDGNAVTVRILMEGNAIHHAESPEPLVKGDWEAVVIKAEAAGYGGLDEASKDLRKPFKVVE